MSQTSITNKRILRVILVFGTLFFALKRKSYGYIQVTVRVHGVILLGKLLLSFLNKERLSRNTSRGGMIEQLKITWLWEEDTIALHLWGIRLHRKLHRNKIRIIFALSSPFRIIKKIFTKRMGEREGLRLCSWILRLYGESRFPTK